MARNMRTWVLADVATDASDLSESERSLVVSIVVREASVDGARLLADGKLNDRLRGAVAEHRNEVCKRLAQMFDDEDRERDARKLRAQEEEDSLRALLAAHPETTSHCDTCRCGGSHS